MVTVRDGRITLSAPELQRSSNGDDDVNILLRPIKQLFELSAIECILMIEMLNESNICIERRSAFGVRFLVHRSGPRKLRVANPPVTKSTYSTWTDYTPNEARSDSQSPHLTRIH